MLGSLETWHPVRVSREAEARGWSQRDYQKHERQLNSARAAMGWRREAAAACMVRDADRQPLLFPSTARAARAA